ncbi:MAG: pyridoxamine 5'-phosphate oxidase family protein [Thermomicrobiales bacterium]
MIPAGELDERYSSPGAAPTPWTVVEEALAQPQTFWVSTVRQDGRPHMTPLLAIWTNAAIHFTTGAGEQKARNLAANPACILATGGNALDSGLDIVIEGEAQRVQDSATLEELAALWKSRLNWNFIVRDGMFADGEQTSLVFVVRPQTMYAFNKGEPFAQTRWRFGDDADSQSER